MTLDLTNQHPVSWRTRLGRLGRLLRLAHAGRVPF